MCDKKTLLLSVWMTTLLLCGCSQPAQNLPVATSPVSRTNANKDVSPIAPAGMKVAISIIAPGKPAITSENDRVMAALELSTNTEITLLSVEAAIYEDHLRLLASSRELPDIVSCVTLESWTMLNNWIGKGIILPFDAAMLAAAPEIASEYSGGSESGYDALKVDKQIYFQPVWWDHKPNPNMGLFHVRKDYLDALGLSPPETLDGIQAAMTLMKQHFGVQGLVYSGRIPNLSGIAGAFGIPYNGWMEADDAITYANTRPEMLRALLWLRRLYELNLVDVESSTLSQDQAEERYIDGKSGFMIFNGGHHVTRIDDMMKQVDPNAQEWLLPAPAGPDGKRGYVVEPSFWGVTFITDTSRNPVLAAALLNYLMTEEGQKLTAYGVEGIHYLEPSPGNIQPIDSGREQETATHWDGNRYHQLASPIISWVNWKYQLWWSLRGKPESYVDWFSEMWANQCRYTTRNAILLPLTVKWSQFQQFSTELTQEYFSRIILGDGNPERLFTEYVDKWFSGGGKEAVQEITRMKLSQIGPR